MHVSTKFEFYLSQACTNWKSALKKASTTSSVVYYKRICRRHFDFWGRIDSAKLLIVQYFELQQLIVLLLQVVVLSALQPPVPRLVYDVVITCSHLDLFLHTLAERQKARQKSSSTPTFTTLAISPKQNNTIRTVSVWCVRGSDGVSVVV